MRKISVKFKLLMAMLLVQIAAAAAPGESESLNYRVMYKWGLINKQAGTVNLSTHEEGGRINALLTAKSAKWADSFYMVRDTLRGVMNKHGLPVMYEKISHEGGAYKHDRLEYVRNGESTKASCHRVDRPKNSTETKESTISLESTGMVLDMLSSFYFMRRLDYQRMEVGDSETVTVFSGTKKETLTITYEGKQTVRIGSEDMGAYKIRFRFTRQGKKSSDDMEAWISTASERIPLKLVGKLAVGQVQCYYMPPNVPPNTKK